MALRVLLIDGDGDRAEAIARDLGAHGCSVLRVAPDHREVLALVRAAGVDVIVCGLDDPSRDVLESMQAVHAAEPRPVVMFIDHGDADHIRAAVDAGVTAYVIEGLAPGRVRPVIDVAIAQFNVHQRLRTELEGARLALDERKIVERAKGILMQTRRLSEDEAYRTLRRLAMDQSKKMHEVAASVISLAKVLRE